MDDGVAPSVVQSDFLLWHNAQGTALGKAVPLRAPAAAAATACCEERQHNPQSLFVHYIYKSMYCCK